MRGGKEWRWNCERRRKGNCERGNLRFGRWGEVSLRLSKNGVRRVKVGNGNGLEIEEVEFGS